MTALPAVFERTPWGLVVVAGPDATSFLQAVVSQDLAPVAVGGTVSSLLLQPQGKLEVAFRATRHRRDDVDGDEWWLDTEPAYASRLAEGLTRYRIRVKVDIDDRSALTALASVIGTDEVDAGSLVAIPTRWADVPGCDVLGPAADVSAWSAATGLRAGSAEELEVLRIEARVPRLGVDVDDATIPQEAFLEIDGVSFTKGCFIGQELVCRIDTRGHVNRFLRRVAIAGTMVPAPGDEVHAGDRSVGSITSAAAVPGEDRVVALAMVRREVEPPAEVVIHAAGAQIPATVLA